MCPDGYEDNNGRLPLLTIPSPDGDHPAVFIKQLDDRRVVGLSAVARGEHDAHIIDLFTAPALDEQPLEPLPHWFCTCLWGDTTDFHPFHEAIIALNDWGILAEVQQYQVVDWEVAVLQAESHLVDMNLAASESAKQAILLPHEWQRRLRPHMAARFWFRLLLGFGFGVLQKSLL